VPVLPAGEVGQGKATAPLERPAGTTTTDQCWPGAHHRWPTREESAQKGVVCQKSGKNLFFQEKPCYHAADERVRLQEQKPSGIFPGQRGSKNHFRTAVAKAAA